MRILKYLLLGMAIAGPLARTALGAPPNIVLIISDDHAWTDYSFMGHPQIRTPNIDRLARESLTFTPRLCAVEPVLPQPGVDHHAALYPHQHKVTSNDPPLPAGHDAGQVSRVSRAFRQGREVMNRHLEAVPHAAARCWPKQGYRELADRQMVARPLPPRRLHPRHDPGRAARRRGPGHRPQDDAADLRLHRPRPARTTSRSSSGTRR